MWNIDTIRKVVTFLFFFFSVSKVISSLLVMASALLLILYWVNIYMTVFFLFLIQCAQFRGGEVVQQTRWDQWKTTKITNRMYMCFRQNETLNCCVGKMCWKVAEKWQRMTGKGWGCLKGQLSWQQQTEWGQQHHATNGSAQHSCDSNTEKSIWKHMELREKHIFAHTYSVGMPGRNEDFTSNIAHNTPWS